MKNELVNELQKELFAAIEKNDLQTVRDLIKKGADVNFQEGGWATPLISACRQNNIEIVQALLTAGADSSVNIQTKNGITALMPAAYQNNPKMVKLLLNAGADVHITTTVDPDGYSGNQSVLLISDAFNQTEIITENCNTALKIELTHNVEILKMLQDAGAK